MARLKEKDNQRRREIIKRYIEEDANITNKQIIDKLKADGFTCTYETVASDLKKIKAESGIESTSEYKILLKSLKTLEAELQHNKKLRSKCTSESASSQYSRIIKDITVKIADISKDLLELKILNTKQVKPQYTICIGSFPIATKKEKPKEQK